MTREVYKEQLRKLNGELIMMGDLCEEAMSLVLKALREKDEAVAGGVHRLEQEIDQKERDIEAMCMKLLLRQQPVAGDLRNISVALRMIGDMERIGDQTADIADICRLLTDFQMEIHPSVFQMGKLASKMVNNSVTAYVRKDEKMARQVIDADNEMDGLFDKVKGELVEEIRKNSDGEDSGYELDLLMIAKYMERIGDHAVNLGEAVIYSIYGQKEKENK